MSRRKMRIAKLSKIILKKIKANNEYVTLVDVGARGGVTNLRRIAKSVRALGIEPNPNEKLLIEGNHYANDPRGFWVTPNYYQLDYFWGAVHPFQKGYVKLHVTKHPGASGIQQPDLLKLNFKYKINMPDKILHKNGFGELFQTVEEISVPTLRLKDLMGKFEIDHIDYLKIDVEGFESEVLESLEENLMNVSLIKIEVCFFAFRKNQKLFDNVFRILVKSGFEFLMFADIQKGYKSNFSKKYWNAKYGFKNVHATWMSADAYFWKVPDTINHKLRGSVVLLHEGFIDQALQCVASDTLLIKEDKLILKHWGMGKKMYTIVKIIIKKFKKFGYLIRIYNSLKR